MGAELVKMLLMNYTAVQGISPDPRHRVRFVKKSGWTRHRSRQLVAKLRPGLSSTELALPRKVS
jgi:hypothetical protein